MKKFLLRFNWISFLSMIALVVIGAMVLASAGEARGSEVFASKWKSMLGTAVFGLVLYFTLALTDYRALFSYLSIPAYGVAVFLLILVLFVGTEQFGGKRWLWFFQPSEISKLCVMAFLAYLFGSREDMFKGHYGFRGFLIASVTIAVPCFLILMEPDLGTTLTLVPAVIVMLLAAGVWRKGLIVLLAAGCVAATTVLAAVYEAEKPGVSAERRAAILKYVPLRPHQVERVKTFLFPETDKNDSGYNLRQSKMTIGAGGFSGKGYGKGESIRRDLLPAMGIMNDFIFCVWAEEMGYMKGSLLLILLFAALCLSTAWTAVIAGDKRGRIFALGVATLIFAHVYINMGMCIGLVPITGLPLPFLSLGRTFLITIMCALGIVQSISLHREDEK
jgi:rod shape determining protein RodA